MEIEFDEETHVYTIGGDKSYRSVTTLLSSWFKPFDELATIRAIRKRPSKYDKYTDEEILAEWENTRNVAAQLGTQMHANIEAFWKGEPVVDDSPEFQFFLQFAQDRSLQPFGIELRLHHEPVKLVGTIDFVSLNEDGTVDVYDWKRSGDLSKGWGHCIHPKLTHVPDTKFWRYSLQLNLYRYLLEKNGHRVRNMYLACFHPSNLSYQVHPVAPMDIPLSSNE